MSATALTFFFAFVNSVEDIPSGAVAAEVLVLTETEMARIEEVCSRGPIMTDYVKDAIAKPWKPVSA